MNRVIAVLNNEIIVNSKNGYLRDYSSIFSLALQIFTSICGLLPLFDSNQVTPRQITITSLIDNGSIPQ